jgi:26S proteasome regulatory subunit N5
MYYSKISLQRISELMNTNVDVCEQEICRLINQKIIVGRINRVEGMIDFIKKKNEN